MSSFGRMIRNISSRGETPYDRAENYILSASNDEEMRRRIRLMLQASYDAGALFERRNPTLKEGSTWEDEWGNKHRLGMGG